VSTRSHEERVAERDRMEVWCSQVDGALPAFERTMPRDPATARFLRSIGTPEALIGPVRSAPTTAPPTAR
jgi:hypothetical protein